MSYTIPTLEHWPQVIPDGAIQTFVPFFATLAAFPAAGTATGTFAVTNDTKVIYFSAFGAWWPLAALQ